MNMLLLLGRKGRKSQTPKSASVVQEIVKNLALVFYFFNCVDAKKPFFVNNNTFNKQKKRRRVPKFYEATSIFPIPISL